MSRRDLVVLVADQDILATMRGLLSQPEKLGIRPVEVQDLVEWRHDPGCVRHADEVLRTQRHLFLHALVVFDHEGSGRELDEPGVVEAHVERQLEAIGWGNDAAAIAIHPEVEAWIWSDSPSVEDALDWKGRKPSLADWLRESGFAHQGHKPQRPKEAYLAALHFASRRPTAERLRRLAERVSFGRCTDPAFVKLRATLQSWFPRLAREIET